METKGGQLNYNAELILYFQRNLEAGYASLYQKMKTKDPSEHPWYKVYNLDDYKKMQREVRLNRGTLGPDLDTESYKDKVGFCISERKKLLWPMMILSHWFLCLSWIYWRSYVGFASKRDNILFFFSDELTKYLTLFIICWFSTAKDTK